MTGYLLDTHAAIWFFNGNDRLSETAEINRIGKIANDPFRITSAWELAIKIGLEKLNSNGKAAGFVRLAESNGFTVLPIKTAYLTTLNLCR